MVCRPATGDFTLSEITITIKTTDDGTPNVSHPPVTDNFDPEWQPIEDFSAIQRTGFLAYGSGSGFETCIYVCEWKGGDEYVEFFSGKPVYPPRYATHLLQRLYKSVPKP